MTQIFDFHTHAYPDKVAEKAVDFLNDYYQVKCCGDGTMDDLLSSAREADVDCILVHAVATKPKQVENVNTWISRQLSKNVIGFGTIHPLYPRIRREIKRIKTLGLKGIKLHPDFQEFNVDSPLMDTVYREIQGELPVLIHAGDQNKEYSSPKRIANLLKRYPALTVIAAHLGGYSVWDESEKYLIGKNLYIDTSSCLWAIPPEKAVDLIRAHGVHHVLFGTDYPITRHREELRRFYTLDLTDEERHLILYENARRLLGLNRI